MLVFLPGIADISNLMGALTASHRFGDRNEFRVLPLHSSLSPAEQAAVFDRMPPGVRKVSKAMCDRLLCPTRWRQLTGSLAGDGRDGK